MNAFAKWLKTQGISGVEAARIFGVTPAQIWHYSRDGYWPAKRRIALRIIRLTGGEVAPNDLLGESPIKARKSREFKALMDILAKERKTANGRSKTRARASEKGKP